MNFEQCFEFLCQLKNENKGFFIFAEFLEDLLKNVNFLFTQLKTFQSVFKNLNFFLKVQMIQQNIFLKLNKRITNKLSKSPITNKNQNKRLQ